jgi:hypothetical protein
MMNGSFRAGLLLLAVQLPVHADWEFPAFTTRPLSPAGMDRAFECEVQRRVEEHGDRLQHVDVVVTRFGNTIVITGQAADAGDRARVDKLVLEEARIIRQQSGSPLVVPASTRGCEGRTIAASSKRKSILDSSKDCSSLRVAADSGAAATGQVFNHIGVAAPDPVAQLARAELLAAQARLSLIEGAVINALDRGLIRLVAQDGVIYVLGSLDAARQSDIRSALMKVTGVADVRFYVD